MAEEAHRLHNSRQSSRTAVSQCIPAYGIKLPVWRLGEMFAEMRIMKTTLVIAQSSKQAE
jgi:hypothetical protein